jgi:hypothetical protein
MVQELKQQLQPFVAGQLFVKLAIGFFGIGEIAKLSYRFVHVRKSISLAATLSERI